MPTFSRRPGFATRMRAERGVRGRVDRRRDRDDLARRTTWSGVRVGRRSRPSGRRGRGPGARPARWRRAPPVQVRHLEERLRRRCRPPARRRSRGASRPARRSATSPSCARAAARRCRAPPAACSTPASAAACCAARVLDLLAGRDAALEQALGALEVEPSRSRARPSPAPRAAVRLPLLVLERPGIDLGHHLAGRDRVALGDLHRTTRPGTSGADATSSFGSGGNGAAHDERLDEVLPCRPCRPRR